MEFDYKRIGPRWYPLVPVRAAAGSHTGEVHALVDSGSMLSLFRLEVAQELGLEYRKGTPKMIASIQGELMVHVHTLELDIAGKRFPCSIGFSEALKPSMNILGRMGFFEQFRITFDEQRRKVLLE